MTQHEQPFQTARTTRRIFAFLIDDFIITLLLTLISKPVLDHIITQVKNPEDIFPKILYLSFISFLIFFAKDSIKGISLGKWIMGIMVRDARDYNRKPGFFRLLLRNIFLIIWPVEFMILILSIENRRLGDKIANTVVLNNPNKAKQSLRILTLLAIIGLYFFTTYYFAGTALKNSDAYKTAVIAIMQNENIVEETGGIKLIGNIQSGRVHTHNDYGDAQFEIKVFGNKKDIVVFVIMEKKPNSKWQVVEMEIE